MGIDCPSFSKVNIGLQILEKRNDDYHNINTIFQELQFGDIITIDEKNSISHIIVNIDVKLEFKYKFLSPLIKKSYKTFLMSILYKMQSIANST